MSSFKILKKKERLENQENIKCGNLIFNYEDIQRLLTM